MDPSGTARLPKGWNGASPHAQFLHFHRPTNLLPGAEDDAARAVHAHLLTTQATESASAEYDLGHGIGTYLHRIVGGQLRLFSPMPVW
jgi:hypothetical protein